MNEYSPYYLCSLESQIAALKRSTAVWKQALTGTSVFIPVQTHQLQVVRGARATDTPGNEIEVGFKVYSDNSVLIFSNIPMDGCTIFIF
jgi:hypothetical protein